MKQPASKNLVASISQVSLTAREQRNRHRGCVLWFTGLSAAGKSTIANELEAALFARGCQTFVLDGDRVRNGLCSDLDFSENSRHENIRRVGEVARLFADAGFICVAAFISPYRADRKQVRAMAGDKFVEVFVNAPLKVCEARDPKGHYAKARARQIKNFTGVSAPYEPPLNPEIEVRTDKLSSAEAVEKILRHLQKKFSVNRRASRGKPAPISWKDW
ncbi:MAG TPA: adenylyl-sulfate kinase [Verrucomicrobiae bacterium]|nr:adenylyl-sulfate kinase [Verrucomicrobiae bacterium]